jgi:hypothetical protein
MVQAITITPSANGWAVKSDAFESECFFAAARTRRPGPATDPPCRGNIYQRLRHNDFNWFGAFENPVNAHTWYRRNPQVLDAVFGR